MGFEDPISAEEEEISFLQGDGFGDDCVALQSAQSDAARAEFVELAVSFENWRGVAQVGVGECLLFSVVDADPGGDEGAALFGVEPKEVIGFEEGIG